MEKFKAKKLELFKKELSSEDQKKELEKIYEAKNGEWSVIRKELTETDGFTDKIIPRLDFVHDLIAWDEKNEKLFDSFKNEEGFCSMRDLAGRYYKNELLIQRILSAEVTPDGQDIDKYAKSMYRKLFAMQPTVMLVNMIKDPEIPFGSDDAGRKAAKVLERFPNFNIKTTSVYEILKDKTAFKDIPVDLHAKVKGVLKTYQSLTALSPEPEAIPALYRAKFFNGFEISEFPPKQFMIRMKDSKLDELTIKQIHRNALKLRVRNENAMTALREAGKPTGVSMIDRSLNTMAPPPKEPNPEKEPQSDINTALEKHNLSWDLLFGDADYCECEHCESMYSPSAYFVDLLEYLRKSGVGDTGDPRDPATIKKTPLGVLLDRRPDLSCLELTCKNTLTEIPYVDLANEVMENYVAHHHTRAFNVDEETSGELLAEPQHTEYLAYCKLLEAVYPSTLPYHQPIDAARIYLKHLNTSRYELMKHFKKSIDDESEEQREAKEEEWKRAIHAEYLHLVEEEYVILTKHRFKPDEHSGRDERAGNRNHDCLSQRLEVRPYFEYYGYDSANEMLGESGAARIKQEFLRRTGITPVELVELLKTQYINPNQPKGKVKTITERLRFSYRFLQNYAKTHDNDYQKLGDYLMRLEQYQDYLQLNKEIELLRNKNTPECLLPDNKDEANITDKDIRHWAMCHFEKLGKMIVVESGVDFSNGQIVQKDDETAKAILEVKDYNIYLPPQDKNDLKKVGHIDPTTGRVILTDTGMSHSQFNDYVFVTPSGEMVEIVAGKQFAYIAIKLNDNCDLETARLQHLDGTPLVEGEWDRIHRFILLWRKLGWTIDEADRAIIGLSVEREKNHPENHNDNREPDPEPDGCTPADRDCGECEEDDCCISYDINPRLLHQLVYVKKIIEKTKHAPIQMLAFWSDISTAGDKSLYHRLFLTHNLLAMDKVFKADDYGNYLSGDIEIDDHRPVLMAALNLSDEDIDAIKISASTGEKLTLSTLSEFYKYRLLSKAIGLRISEFVKVPKVFGEIFHDARATYTFLKQWERMEKVGFRLQQLHYIINQEDDEKKPFAPTKIEILKLAKQLYDGLNEIDRAHPDLNADGTISDGGLQQEGSAKKVDEEYVRTKAGLLFDTTVVERIIEFLEGRSIYRDVGPKNLEIHFSEDGSLKQKLTYNPKSGVIQIIGILTTEERGEYLSLSHNPAWSKALECIESLRDQQYKELFQELIVGLTIESDRELSAGEITQIKSELKRVLLGGDIGASENPTDDDPAPTAPQKRLAFLTFYLPYLRQELTRQFVLETLSNFIEADRKLVDVFVSIIHTGEPGGEPEPIYEIFKSIKEMGHPAENSWCGYLISPGEAEYTLVVRSETSPTITLNHENLDFVEQATSCAGDEEIHEYWSKKPVSLRAGDLYTLTVAGVGIKTLFWKTATSAITPVPQNALLPDYAKQNCESAINILKRAAMLAVGLDLSDDEIGFFHKHKANFDNIEFNSFKYSHWLRLEAYKRLRDSLPKAKIDMLEFWKRIYDGPANQESEKEYLIANISGLTNWKEERIEKLIDVNHFNRTKLENFSDEKNLLQLQKALKTADKIGMSIDLLFDWAVPTSHFNHCRKIADSIKHAIRGRYNQTDWEEVVKPLHDQLRNNQKGALIAYLLQQEGPLQYGVTDANGLFEFFLIDVQMDACMVTSRIKQAISSVQLFIQRCFLGLEENKSDDGIGEEKSYSVSPDELDRDRWKWMQRYRVWEANRKVFLYPENWIEPNLRDDKSPFFQELESELLQNDINKKNVSNALKTYLYKVDEVANLEVVGLYIEDEESDKDDDTWGEGSKLHIFGRTRNAPYFFYYRYLALKEMNWYPWEKMQVDIPSYDVEETITRKITTDNGCFLVPVVWKGRLLVFFPQIMKKTRQADVKNDNTGESLQVQNYGTKTQEDIEPKEYFEIKMAWSEYQNRKWTQKQISNHSIHTDIVSPLRYIEFFMFVPRVLNDNIIIYVDDDLERSQPIFRCNNSYNGCFVYNGDSIQASRATVSIGPVLPVFYFNQSFGGLYSLQLYNDGNALVNDYIRFANNLDLQEVVYGLPKKDDQVTFHHPETKELLGKLNTAELKDLFQYQLETTDADLDFGPYDHDSDPGTPTLYHELKSPYSIYNWEMFFHTAATLADTLSKAQHYEEAMKWYHYIFDPTAEGTDEKRFWQFRPFREVDQRRILETIFHNLESEYAERTIEEWRKDPFKPHLVARSRPVAYMKWIVMKYIDNLVAWGDYLFRQDTIESINQATQLYILAWHILGEPPKKIPKRGKLKPQTYWHLVKKLDSMGNAMQELEVAFPFSAQTTLQYHSDRKELVHANIYGQAHSLYFCIPNNPQLLEYWDTIQDRLYKIRHCQNMEGVFRSLPLFEPPIDPGLLVNAAAHGLSIASVLNDLNTPMPNYRFYYLLQKALELCGEVKSMGSALLSAIEKRDNEAIALIRAKHESGIQNRMMEIKKKQREEAQKSLESLEQNRKGPEHRMRYYLKLIGEDTGVVPGLDSSFSELTNSIEKPKEESGLKLNKYEKEEMDKAGLARLLQKGIGEVEVQASLAHMLPELGTVTIPWGVGIKLSFGGAQIGGSLQAIARRLQIISNDLTYQSTNAGRKGGHRRALQERIFQANAAGYEIKQIDKQIVAQKIRMELADLEINNQQKLIDNTQEVEDFLKNKYTNEELYTWMRDNLKTLYHQVYGMAYELAKRAEKVYRFERGIENSNFIQPGYWNTGRDGLLAGEQLYVGLKQLEAAYQNERGYDYEITKHVSIHQLHPFAIMQLRETGVCEFELPEVLFDMDYPGHYRRRIKSVSISIPCIAGPYTGVNATLRLLAHKFRNTSIIGSSYPEKIDEEDERFTTHHIPVSAIAVSGAQNESGMFELNFKDERYLPFEGAGVISSWRLELPRKVRQFDYQTISDVILHVKYTSREGGEALRSEAENSLQNQLSLITQELSRNGLHQAMSMKHEFSQEWHQFIHSGSVNMTIESVRLPYMVQAANANLKIEDVLFLAKGKEGESDFSFKVDGKTLNPFNIEDLGFSGGTSEDIVLDKPFILSKEDRSLAKLEELFIIVKYSFLVSI